LGPVGLNAKKEISTDGPGPVGLNFLFPEFSFKRCVVFEAAKTRFGSSKLDKNESANH